MSDAELVMGTRRGDQRAFAELVRRYRDRHVRFVARMLGDADEAEDVLQSAFVRAFRHIARCDEPARFGSWLHRIVVNECRTFATRRGNRESRFVREPLVLEQLEAAASESDHGLLATVKLALAALPADQREAFVMKHVEEMEYEEMAELTGVGVSALKMRVKRAIERLREQLEGVANVA